MVLLQYQHANGQKNDAPQHFYKYDEVQRDNNCHYLQSKTHLKDYFKYFSNFGGLFAYDLIDVILAYDQC